MGRDAVVGALTLPTAPPYPPGMRTEIFESDPFSPQKGTLLATLNTDYRFERNDEIFLTAGGKRLKVRVINVRVEISGDQVRRELLVLKL